MRQPAAWSVGGSPLQPPHHPRPAHRRSPTANPQTSRFGPFKSFDRQKSAGPFQARDTTHLRMSRPSLRAASMKMSGLVVEALPSERQVQTTWGTRRRLAKSDFVAGNNGIHELQNFLPGAGRQKRAFAHRHDGRRVCPKHKLFANMLLLPN